MYCYVYSLTQMLSLDEYGGGAEAKYNSWVILEKAAAVREEAGGS